MKDPIAISISHLSKSFSQTLVLQDIHLEINAGRFVTLLGPSGCGKTTLLRLVAGLETPTSGSLHFGQNLTTAKSYVFQDANLLPWKTVAENIALPFKVGNLKKKYSVTEIKNKIQTALSQVQLSGSENLFPHELSGGMKMRVSLARALVTEPALLLLDEPFAALDEVTRFEMQDLLLRLWQEKQMTILFVTHSLFEAAYLSERVILLKKADVADDLTLSRLQKTSPSFRSSAEMLKVVEDLAQRLRS